MQSKEEVLDLMAEGNADAMKILYELLRVRGEDTALFTILNMDDMNVRGAQIVIGHRDFSLGNTMAFADAVDARSPAMVYAINAGTLKEDGILHKAVTDGASMEPRQFLVRDS